MSSSETSHIDNGHQGSSSSGDVASSVYMTIFILRGMPDVYYKRHVLLYFTSPDNPDIHETVHVQRDDEQSPWNVYREKQKMDWVAVATYIGHVNAGCVSVKRGQETLPADIIASTQVEGKDEDSGWNCQNFLLEGLQELVHRGYQTQEWYQWVEEDLINKLLDGAVT